MGSERLEWIKRRSAVGYDWSGAVEAMAHVTVEHTAEGVVIDTSAINRRGEHWPTRALLMPVEGGWYFQATGHTGPLTEWLWTMTLSALDEKLSPAVAEHCGEAGDDG